MGREDISAGVVYSEQALWCIIINHAELLAFGGRLSGRRVAVLVRFACCELVGRGRVSVVLRSLSP